MQPDAFSILLSPWVGHVTTIGSLLVGRIAVRHNEVTDSKVRAGVVFLAFGGIVGGLAAVPVGPIASAKISQPIKDRAIENVVQQANQNFKSVTGPRNRSFDMRTQFGDTIYAGKAKLEVTSTKPEANAPTHLCLRVNDIEGKKIDVATKLQSGNFHFFAGMWNERCYSTGPDGKFRPNPRVTFGATGPAFKG